MLSQGWRGIGGSPRTNVCGADPTLSPAFGLFNESENNRGGAARRPRCAAVDGDCVGLPEGDDDGDTEGLIDGLADGLADGEMLGDDDGLALGLVDGLALGLDVGASTEHAPSATVSK